MGSLILDFVGFWIYLVFCWICGFSDGFVVLNFASFGWVLIGLLQLDFGFLSWYAAANVFFAVLGFRV